MSTSTTKVPAQISAPKPPSVHARALITWVAIFPLVTVGSLATAAFATGWDPVLRSFVITIAVVPIAVYLVVPQLMRVYGKIRAGRRLPSPTDRPNFDGPAGSDSPTEPHPDRAVQDVVVSRQDAPPIQPWSSRPRSRRSGSIALNRLGVPYR